MLSCVAALLGCFLVPVIWRACGRPGGRRTERRVPPGACCPDEQLVCPGEQVVAPV